MARAISWKGGQLFHRLIKKKTDVLARPVSKQKSTTTADQEHADEQIDQWAKVWDAKYDPPSTHIQPAQAQPSLNPLRPRCASQPAGQPM